jgi:hypothetical protein
MLERFNQLVKIEAVTTVGTKIGDNVGGEGMTVICHLLN